MRTMTLSVNTGIYFYMRVAENQISVDDGLAKLQSFPFLKHLNANKRLYLFIFYCVAEQVTALFVAPFC